MYSWLNDSKSFRRFTMNNKGKIVPLLILMIALPACAGGVKKIAQTGMKWLSIPVGARASAMGGAYTAIANDVSAVFWNPAGVALTDGYHLSLSRTQWIADILVNAGAVSLTDPNWGTFGLCFDVMHWGTFHGTQKINDKPYYVETGDFSPQDWTVGLFYGRRISSQFSFGANIKYIYENLGSTLEGLQDNPRDFTAKMTLFAFDIGTLYYTGFKDLRFGMSLQNFSQEKQYRIESFPLPLTFKFGVAMDVISLFQTQSAHHVTLAVDAIHPRDFTERLHVGCEYSYQNKVFLRGGYKTNYDEEGLTVGAGALMEVNRMAVGIDYSYLFFEHFDPVQMFSFDFKF
jgi:hypothetical protein